MAFIVVSQVTVITIVVTLMMPAKLTTLSFLRIKLFLSKRDEVIISVHNVTNKFKIFVAVVM